jgi:hypothetical protein
LAGAPLFATATPYEQAVAAAEAALVGESGVEPPPWGALAAGASHCRWGKKVYAELREAALDEEQTARALHDESAAARVESCSGPGSLWLGSTIDFGDGCVDPAPGGVVQGPPLKEPTVRPAGPGADSFVIPDDAAKALVRFRLGLFRGGGRCGRKSSSEGAQEFCPCRDASARHRVTCPFGPWATWRHNRFARLLQILILEIPGAAVRWTPRASFWPRKRGGDGEPDLRVDIPGLRTFYIDVAVAFPRSSEPGRAARMVENTKEDDYSVWYQRQRVQPVDFWPCVVEAYGRFGRRSAALIRMLAKESAAVFGISAPVETRRWFSLLGRRLQIDQADILLNGSA